MRRVIAALVVVGLGIAVFLLWPRSDPEEPPIGEATTTSSTSTTEPSTTTSTTTVTTTTTFLPDDRTVETVEEAEEILREFLFLWFLSIYEQDLELLQSITGNPRQVEAAEAQFGVMEFEAEPTREDIIVEDLEILRADTECLATWSDAGAGFRGGVSSGVHVFRWQDGSWLFINTWLFREDRWEDDCESVVQP